MACIASQNSVTSRRVVSVSAIGRELDEPLQALAQWGGRSLGSIQPGQAPSRDSILLTVRALAGQLFAAHGLRSAAVLLSGERYAETIVARAEGNAVSVITDRPAEVEVEIELDLDTLFALASGMLTLRAGLEQGKVHLRGQPALVERLRGKGADREN